MFFLTFYAISNISRKKNLGIKIIISHLMFCFVCWKYCKVPLHLQLLVKWELVSPNSRYREFYHEIGNIEKFPFTYWLNGRWFLQIVDIHVGNFYMKLTGRWFPQIVQWESISNIYMTKIVVLVSEPVRGRSRATELPCFLCIQFLVDDIDNLSRDGFD